MTTAAPSPLIEVNTVETVSPRSVSVAGVAWPVYKLHAVACAVLVALATILVTGSGQITMWASALTLLAVWWGERFFGARRDRS